MPLTSICKSSGKAEEGEWLPLLQGLEMSPQRILGPAAGTCCCPPVRWHLGSNKRQVRPCSLSVMETASNPTFPLPYLTLSVLITTPGAGAADPCSARERIQNMMVLLPCQATTELFNLFRKICLVPGVEGNSPGSAWNLFFSPFPGFFRVHLPFAVAAPGEGRTIPLSSISWQ